MPIDMQSEITDFLIGGSASRADDDKARVIGTHISVVVLKGKTAWKLKRPLHLPYADFSSPELRLAACKRELQLNRRTAASLYKAVRRITREGDGSLAFDGTGELVDAVVEMARFDEDTLFSRLATNGGLTRPLLSILAQDIAGFHRQAEVRCEDGAANIAAVLELNEQSDQLEVVLGEAHVGRLRRALRAGLDTYSHRLTARGEAGRIRLCHGDLHLRNICLVEGRPTLFDCIEFNDALATADVLYDLAFLLMDLWQVGLREEANWVMNRYVDESEDDEDLYLLPYFMALRASIRAQVLATQALTLEGQEHEELVDEAGTYLQLALQLLAFEAPRMLAIGGLSGSGKSTLASAVAHRLGPAPGARVLSSDRIRKTLAGVSAETQLAESHYSMEASRRVYATLYAKAGDTLRSGHAVVADAVFARDDERAAIEECAVQAGIPFQGVWLEADVKTLMARVQARRNDPSDATVQVLEAQLKRGVGTPAWPTIPSHLPIENLLNSIPL